MSDNNSDDEALKEIDSEGESTESVSGQPAGWPDTDSVDSPSESISFNASSSELLSLILKHSLPSFI